MGEDKAFVLLNGHSLIWHVVASIEVQVERVLISSNADPACFAPFGHPVLADCLPGYQGPLAGLLTGLCWAQRTHPQITHLLSAPCDIPNLPLDIGKRLTGALKKNGAEIAVARDHEGLQPTIGLWPLALAGRLRDDLVRREIRGIQGWLRQFRVAEVQCSDLANINTPADLCAAQVLPL
jgi:molybdopterin-guanine dinucleotide biosynthesis protein A